MLKKHYKAYSLVEVSVVLTIISILLYGVISVSKDFYNDYRRSIARKLTVTSSVNSIPSLSLWLDYSNPENYLSYNRKFPQNDWQSVGIVVDQNPLNSDKITTNGKHFGKEWINGLSCNVVSSIYNVYVDPLNRPMNTFISTKGYSYFFVAYIDDGGNSGGAIFKFFNQSDTYNFYYAYWNNGYSPQVSNIGGWNMWNYEDYLYSPKRPLMVSAVHNVDEKYSYLRVNRSNKIIKSDLNDTAIKTANLSENANIYWGTAIGGHYLSGCIGEFIIFSEPLTDSQVYKIEEYLSKKWNIPLVQK